MANSITRTLLLDEIKRRGWQAETIGHQAYFLKVIHPDGRHVMLHGTMPTQTSSIAYQIAKKKHVTMDFVASLGYRTPAYAIVNDANAAAEFLAQHPKVVVKPADGERTLGVTVGLTDPQALPAAFASAQAHSETGQVIIQEHLEGKLYRLMVIDGKFVAASWRRAATVVGDGQSSIEQLIVLANQDPRRGKGTDTPLKQIDAVYAKDFLGEAVFTSVPSAGEAVTVSDIDSVSAGGEAQNVTDQVSASWQEACIHIAQEAGLFVAGYDVICDDIAQPLQQGYVPLLEVNAGPGMKLHEYPSGGGEPIHLAPILLDALFTEGIAKQA